MSEIVQGTGVCFDGVGVLIIGASGAGKTSLALSLIDTGGTLIGDDGVLVDVTDGTPFMAPVETTRGQIEVRGVGIVSGMPVVERHTIDVLISLEKQELPRLPDDLKTQKIAGVLVPCFSLKTGDFSLTNKVKMIIKILKRQVNLSNP